MKILLIMPIILLAACERPPCEGPFPGKVYVAGEKAIHTPTGETVRIISEWTLWSSDKCEKKKFGKYTVRFSDGAEISATWENLN